MGISVFVNGTDDVPAESNWYLRHYQMTTGTWTLARVLGAHNSTKGYARRF